MDLGVKNEMVSVCVGGGRWWGGVCVCVYVKVNGFANTVNFMVVFDVCLVCVFKLFMWFMTWFSVHVLSLYCVFNFFLFYLAASTSCFGSVFVGWLEGEKEGGREGRREGGKEGGRVWVGLEGINGLETTYFTQEHNYKFYHSKVLSYIQDHIVL